MTEYKLNEETLQKRDFLPSFDELIQHHIPAVEKEILGIREQIVQLQLQHSERVRLLQKLRSAAAPIRLISTTPELLTEVFRWLWLLHAKDNPESTQIRISGDSSGRKGRIPWQFVLRQICFTWREVALSTHFLWSNIIVVAPQGSMCYRDPRRKTLEDWDGHNEWITLLTTARDLLSSKGHALVGIDLQMSGWESADACQLAVERFYNPLAVPGRRISALIQGHFSQIETFFSSSLQHPEVLEQIILWDNGSDGFLDEMLADSAANGELLRNATNFHKLDLISRSKSTFMFDEESMSFLVIPWEQVTHLVIEHRFDDICYGSQQTILNIVALCKHLVHLTLIVGLSDDPYQGYNSDTDDEYDIDADDLLCLPQLKSLVVSFDMHLFFRHLVLPSLSLLEIQNKFPTPIGDLIKFIHQSQCTITNFVETNSNPEEFRKITQKNFQGLVDGLRNVEILRTATKLSEADLKSIAAGTSLPCVKVLQFSADMSSDHIREILRPRFKSNIDPSGDITGFDEVVVFCSVRRSKRCRPAGVYDSDSDSEMDISDWRTPREPRDSGSWRSLLEPITLCMESTPEYP